MNKIVNTYWDSPSRLPVFREEYTDSDGKWHREDGPAISCSDNSEAWWIHGKLHRLDGPAVLDNSGYKAWWIDGKQIRVELPSGTVYNFIEEHNEAEEDSNC